MKASRLRVACRSAWLLVMLGSGAVAAAAEGPSAQAPSAASEPEPEPAVTVVDGRNPAIARLMAPHLAHVRAMNLPGMDWRLAFQTLSRDGYACAIALDRWFPEHQTMCLDPDPSRYPGCASTSVWLYEDAGDDPPTGVPAVDYPPVVKRVMGGRVRRAEVSCMTDVQKAGWKASNAGFRDVPATPGLQAAFDARVRERAAAVHGPDALLADELLQGLYCRLEADGLSCHGTLHRCRDARLRFAPAASADLAATVVESRCAVAASLPASVSEPARP